MANHFEAQTCWSTEDKHHWHGEIDPSWSQGRATFGGVITGAALEAMQSLVEPQRRPRDISTQFLGPVSPGPVTLTAELLRNGRSLTNVQARIEQNGSPRALFQASFAADRASDLTVPHHPRPSTKPLEEVPDMPYLEGITPTFTQHFAYRWTEAQLPFSGSAAPVVRGWVKHRTRASRGYAAVVALLDAWPAPVLPIAKHPFPASTVSWTAYFTEPLEQTPEGWWWFASDTTTSSSRYATTTGKIYHPNGTLVAHMHQLVAVFDKR